MPRSRSQRKRTRSENRGFAVAPAGLSGGRFKPLGDDDVVRIIDAAKVVLERTGVEIGVSPCRDLLKKAGCRVDADRDRVFFHRTLVEEALSTRRSEVLLAGRDPCHDLDLSGSRVHFGTGGQAVKVLDLDGRVRETVLADNYHIGRLVDTLEHIHFYMRPVVARDLATEDIDVNQFYACMAATPKHVMANAYVPSQVPLIREMGDIMAGGAAAFDSRPILSFTASWTVSPLRYALETLEALDAIVDHGMPIVTSSAPQAGATAPAALAGTLVQLVAEQLSGIVYINLRRPSHPLIMGCVPAQADLRTGAFTGGSGEFALLNAACAQIAQHLGMPLYNSSGISDSKVPDAQAGAEKALTGLAAALAGSNYIHHSAGFLESLLTVAYEQYVIDNDINGALMRMVRGIEVTEETLSVDVIDDVCNGPNHFLGHQQTLDLMNTEYLYPTLMNRSSRDDWQAAGAQALHEAARDRARQVLAEHWPEPISADVDADLRRRFNILLPRDEMRPGA